MWRSLTLIESSYNGGNYVFHVDEQSKKVNALSIALNNTMKGLQHYISEITKTVVEFG